MKVIKRICDVIDLVNDWIGRIASFAVLGILAVIVTEVVLRRLSTVRRSGRWTSSA